MKLNRKRILSSAIILFAITAAFTACTTTDFKDELNILKTSTIKPEKQKGFDKENTKYIEMKNAKIGKGRRKKERQDVFFRLYGNLDGNIFTVNEIYWFDNNSIGWTEISFAATGKLQFNDEKCKTYKVLTPVKIDFVQAAKFRIKDSVLIGENAIKVLNNRLDRIQAAIDFLREPSEYVNKTRYIDYFSFQNNIGSILFPEIYGYSGTGSLFGNIPKTGENKGNYVRGDGILWNVEYTKAVFPEYMWDVRNSGTLYKDWEQDFDLIYYLYNWDFLFGENAKMGIIAKKSWK